MRQWLAAISMLVLAACAGSPPTAKTVAATAASQGRFLEWESSTIEGLPPQRITLWLPPGYDRTTRHYPVLYMHDGQNLFDPAKAHYGKIWGIDAVLIRLVAEGKVEPHIVVGIWSPGEDRYRQYLPRPAAQGVRGALKADVERMSGGPNLSARYLQWLADEVKPTIDGEFRTRPAPADTTIIGASMGGIMACYAAIERPDVFGRAGCVSAHWPIASPELATQHRVDVEEIWRVWLKHKAHTARGTRLWLDHGTVGLDGYYGPFQQAIARDLVALGWDDGRDFTARVYEGAEHDELAWNARLPAMLDWLWRKERETERQSER